MAEQYVEQLAAARERIVADRRELADELAKPYERGRYEQWRRIIEVQATVDAIDRAITDERSIKDKGKPVSFWTQGNGPLIALAGGHVENDVGELPDHLRRHHHRDGRS